VKLSALQTYIKHFTYSRRLFAVRFRKKNLQYSSRKTPQAMSKQTYCIPYTAQATTAEVRLRAGSPPQLLPLIQTRWLRFFGHVARMGDSQDTSRALYTSIRGLPKDWRRRPGRPRRTWLRTMEAGLQPLNDGLK